MGFKQKIVQRSGAVDTIHHHDDGTLTIETKQNMDGVIEALREEKNEATRLNLHPSRTEFGTKIASIPQTIVTLWEDEGFYLMSPARSGMNEEEHQKELFRRLNGDWSLLNVSKYGRL